MGQVLYQSFRLVFGTLYPAYCSFKAVKTKNVKDYVHWMTYWIVFAVFTISEELSDLLLSFWLPLYYECKIALLVWLLSPATRGSTLIYRQIIHPALISREEDIDDLMKRWKEQSYHLGLKYTKVAAQKLTKTVIETAIAGGGGLVDTLRHSYSMNDLRGVPYSERSSYDEQGPSDGRVMPRSWHEGPRYDHIEEEDGEVQTRAIRGRMRAQTGSLLALTSESDQNENASDRQDPRRRRGGSVRQKEHPSSSSMTRSGSVYATLPRKPRKPRSPLPDLQPLVRRSTLSKENVPLEESDSETTAKLHRTVSASPVKKRVKKPPPSSFDSKLESSLDKEKKVRPMRPKRKTASTLPTPEEAAPVSEPVEDVQEDNFSMTYSEEDKKDAKKKCDIS
eukprot:GFUD01010864.1.p1 GENE.GFUD01010864.1~~GFUD01010864.1.p1  ORF type:complete len:393 (-),score=72.18 GFUD01010864.1:143-1321(-)